MEDVLDLYEEEHNPQRPWVCFDESPYHLVSETCPPQPMTPQHPRDIDYEYRREGTCNLFLFLQPQIGWHHVEVTAQRTAQGFAHCMQALVDVHFPTADKIRVVLNNLHTHTLAALYQTFPPAETRRIACKLEFHYTPEHGRWLTIAEVEFSVLSTQCLDRHLSSQDHLATEIGAWEAERNAEKRTITWTFTTPKARTTLGRLYPKIAHASSP